MGYIARGAGADFRPVGTDCRIGCISEAVFSFLRNRLTMTAGQLVATSGEQMRVVESEWLLQLFRLPVVGSFEHRQFYAVPVSLSHPRWAE